MNSRRQHSHLGKMNGISIVNVSTTERDGKTSGIYLFAGKRLFDTTRFINKEGAERALRDYFS